MSEDKVCSNADDHLSHLIKHVQNEILTLNDKIADLRSIKERIDRFAETHDVASRFPGMLAFLPEEIVTYIVSMSTPRCCLISKALFEVMKNNYKHIFLKMGVLKVHQDAISDIVCRIERYLGNDVQQFWYEFCAKVATGNANSNTYRDMIYIGCSSTKLRVALKVHDVWKIVHYTRNTPGYDIQWSLGTSACEESQHNDEYALFDLNYIIYDRALVNSGSDTRVIYTQATMKLVIDGLNKSGYTLPTQEPLLIRMPASRDNYTAKIKSIKRNMKGKVAQSSPWEEIAAKHTVRDLMILQYLSEFNISALARWIIAREQLGVHKTKNS